MMIGCGVLAYAGGLSGGPLSSLAFSRSEDTRSMVLQRASLKAWRELQSRDSLAHSAVAHAHALPAGWEIMKATLARSVGNAWGESSKCISQFITNDLNCPKYPEKHSGGASQALAPV